MQVNYWPSTLDDVQTSPDSKEAQAVSSARIEGQRVKQVGSPECWPEQGASPARVLRHLPMHGMLSSTMAGNLPCSF